MEKIDFLKNKRPTAQTRWRSDRTYLKELETLNKSKKKTDDYKTDNTVNEISSVLSFKSSFPDLFGVDDGCFSAID